METPEIDILLAIQNADYGGFGEFEAEEVKDYIENTSVFLAFVKNKYL